MADTEKINFLHVKWKCKSKRWYYLNVYVYNGNNDAELRSNNTYDEAI